MTCLFETVKWKSSDWPCRPGLPWHDSARAWVLKASKLIWRVVRGEPQVAGIILVYFGQRNGTKIMHRKKEVLRWRDKEWCHLLILFIFLVKVLEQITMGQGSFAFGAGDEFYGSQIVNALGLKRLQNTACCTCNNSAATKHVNDLHSCGWWEALALRYWRSSSPESLELALTEWSKLLAATDDTPRYEPWIIVQQALKLLAFTMFHHGLRRIQMGGPWPTERHFLPAKLMSCVCKPPLQDVDSLFVWIRFRMAHLAGLATGRSCATKPSLEQCKVWQAFAQALELGIFGACRACCQ